MDLELGESLDTDIWCHNTRWVKEACQFTWTIPTFSKCVLIPGSFMTSDIFKTSSPGSCDWYLKLYPSGVNDENSHYVHVALCCKSNYNIVANFFVCLKSQQEKLEHVFVSTVQQSAMKNVDNLFPLIERKLLDQNQDLLPNDVLTIICTVAEKTAVGEKRTVLYERNYFKKEVYYENTSRVILAEDMYSLLETGVFHDVALNAPGVECLAHRCILAARSSVFGEIFTRQPEQYRFYIDNIDSWALEAMLRYIYSKDHGYLTEETAGKLLVAAKKYKLGNLEMTCSTYLASVITKGNSLKLLRLGHLLKDQKLMIESLRFVYSFQKSVIGDDTWNTLLKSEPGIHSDIARCRIAIDKAEKNEKLEKLLKKSAAEKGATDVDYFQQHRRRLTWAIEEFEQHSRLTNTPTFSTPDFQVSDRSDFRCRIELMVSPKTNTEKSRLSILMLRISMKSQGLQLDYECSVVDKDKKLRELTKGGADNGVIVPFDTTEEELLPNGCLTLHFDIKICNRQANESSNPVSPTWCVAQNSLVADLMKLLLHAKSNADVIVVCDGHQARAHKCVLGARSTVLSTMFRKNELINKVEIQGVDAVLLLDLLSYFYTGELKNLTEFTASKLSVVGKSYEIHGLSELCSEFLSSRVSASNAVEYLLMAQKNGDGRLRMYTMSLLRFHADVMIPQQKREDFLRKYGLLALEIWIGPFS